MPHPKTRGIRRRLATYNRQLSEFTEAFQEPVDEVGYWHLHISIAPDFIESPRTPHRVRRECIQSLLDASSRLRALRTLSISKRLVVAVTTPHLADSQLIGFISQDYFDAFFQREGPDQHWSVLPMSRSLAREWSLQLPPGFSERGVHEHIRDGDYEQQGEIWFLGELA